MISASDESENVSLVNQVFISAGFKMAGQSAFLTNILAHTKLPVTSTRNIGVILYNDLSR